MRERVYHAEGRLRIADMSRINRANGKKTIEYLRRNGLIHTWYAVRERMDEGKREPYCYVPPTEQELEKQRTTSMNFQGIISVVVPTYHTAPEYMRELLDSLLQQTYPHWELILADASSDNSVEKVVKTYSDERIRYIRLGGNAGIAQNTNQALKYATGEYIGLLDHDDVLTDDALYEMAAALEKGMAAGIEVKMLYSDEDKCNGDRTEYYEPNRKEKFNLDLLLSNNYICHFLMMESALIKELGFRTEYDGAQDYDLVLRAAERLLHQEEQIIHIPKVLYHWRCHTGSTAENPRSKQYAYEAGRKALQDFADRMGWNATAEHLRHLGFYKLTYLSGNRNESESGNTPGNHNASESSKSPENSTASENSSTSEAVQNEITAILRSRADLGAVGGRVLEKGKVVGGRMTEEGLLFYEGLPAEYSGYLHRAVLTQNAEAVDIRAIGIRGECIPLFEKITGVSYKENSKTNFFDISALPENADYRKLSVEFGKALRKAGYRLLYQPSLTVKKKGRPQTAEKAVMGEKEKSGKESAWKK